MEPEDDYWAGFRRGRSDMIVIMAIVVLCFALYGYIYVLTDGSGAGILISIVVGIAFVRFLLWLIDFDVR
jgi:hypothetical protein